MEADKFFKQAVEKFDSALRNKPELYETLNNWGAALSYWAKNKSGVDADDLFRQANEKYEDVLKIDPNNHTALFNCGVNFVDWAKTKVGLEADLLFEKANKKHEELVGIKPDDVKVINSWGSMLSVWSKVVSEDRKTMLLNRAIDILNSAEAIEAGSASYNLACVYAVNGVERECHKWLLISRKFGELPSKAYIEKDTDLDSVRDKEWFIEFMKEVK